MQQPHFLAFTIKACRLTLTHVGVEARTIDLVVGRLLGAMLRALRFWSTRISSSQKRQRLSCTGWRHRFSTTLWLEHPYGASYTYGYGCDVQNLHQPSKSVVGETQLLSCALFRILESVNGNAINLDPIERSGQNVTTSTANSVISEAIASIPGCLEPEITPDPRRRLTTLRPRGDPECCTSD